jgi:hypothetical protein
MSNKITAEDFFLKKEDKKNYKNSVIERRNLANEFTLGDIENHKVELEKMERELTAQIRVSNAAADNVCRNHVFVSKMSDEQLNAAHYLWETKMIIKKSEVKLKEVRAARKKYNQIIEIALQKFGFVKSNIINNEPAE